MKQEAIEALDRRAFTRVVRNVLKEEPEGLRSVALRRRVQQHSELGMGVPMKYFHVWLAELSRDDAIVIDVPNNRYLHPRHADEEPEAYRQQYGRPPSGLGSDGE